MHVTLLLVFISAGYLKQFVANAQTVPGSPNINIDVTSNLCTACDWGDTFCGWKTSPSVVNGTIHWLRVENFYPKHGDPTQSNDVNEQVITSSARRKASYFNGQWIDPSAYSNNNDNQTTTAFPNSGQVNNPGIVNMDSCSLTDVELPPKAYSTKSSFLQVINKPIACDGEIVAWRYVSLPSTSTIVRTVYASIWEPLSIDPSILTLVGWNLLPVGAFSQWQQFNINKPDRIRVKKGQFVGLHYATITIRHEFAVVPHLEVIDDKNPYVASAVTTFVSNSNHSQIEELGIVRINPSTASRRLLALRAVVRAVRPKTEFDYFGDFYISAEALPSLPVVGTARITSPTIQPITKYGQIGYCLFFKYFLKHGGPNYNQRSTLTVWLGNQGTTDTSAWEVLLTRNTETFGGPLPIYATNKHSPVAPPWSYGNAKITRREQPFYLVFEANPASGGIVALGGVEITPEPCTYMRETDILIPIASIPYGLIQNGQMWQDGQIPYVIDKDFTLEEKRLIEQSMDEFRSMTCINFTPHILGGAPSWSPYVRFRRPIAYCSGFAEPVCATFVGPQSPETLAPFAEHPVYLDPRCFYPQGTILHLLMHVIGLWHETNRPSRDQFVSVNMQQVVWHHKADFQPYPVTSQSYSNLNEFDFDSVTHLPPNAYSDDHFSHTVTPLENPLGIVGQRYKISEGDANKVNWLYASFKSCSHLPNGTAILITTAPPRTSRPIVFTEPPNPNRSSKQRRSTNANAGTRISGLGRSLPATTSTTTSTTTTTTTSNAGGQFVDASMTNYSDNYYY